MDRQMRRKLAAGVAVLAVASVTAVLLVSCGSDSGGGSAATPQSIAITPVAQSGTTVDAKVGDTVVVSLDANATTGYEWSFTAGDTFTIVKSDYVPDENAENMAGAGGTQVVTLEVKRAGSSELIGVYAQPWATPSPPTMPDFSMTVVSTE